jgi:hypothetical protein
MGSYIDPARCAVVVSHSGLSPSVQQELRQRYGDRIVLRAGAAGRVDGGG